MSGSIYPNGKQWQFNVRTFFSTERNPHKSWTWYKLRFLCCWLNNRFPGEFGWVFQPFQFWQAVFILSSPTWFPLDFKGAIAAQGSPSDIWRAKVTSWGLPCLLIKNVNLTAKFMLLQYVNRGSRKCVVLEHRRVLFIKHSGLFCYTLGP